MRFRTDRKSCDLWIALYFLMLGFVAFVSVLATYMDFMTTMFGLRADPSMEANPYVRNIFLTSGPAGLYNFSLHTTAWLLAAFVLALGFVLIARFFSISPRLSIVLYGLSVVLFLALLTYDVQRLVVVYNNFWNVYFMTGGG